MRLHSHEVFGAYKSRLPVRRASWPPGFSLHDFSGELGISDETGVSIPYRLTLEDLAAGDWEVATLQ